MRTYLVTNLVNLINLINSIDEIDEIKRNRQGGHHEWNNNGAVGGKNGKGSNRQR